MTKATNRHNKKMKNRIKKIVNHTEKHDNGKILCVPLDASELTHRKCTHCHSILTIHVVIDSQHALT